MLNPSDIQEALRVCYDPAIPLNIVDLGLVHSINLAPDPLAPGAGIAGVPAKSSLTLTLTPTSTDEAECAQLTAQIANCLAGLPELSKISIQLLDAPAWTPARITLHGRRQLGLDQPQFTILNNRLR